LLLSLSTACTEPWRNVYSVEGLRVLAVRAEPPDLAPGQYARLDALVVDPRDPERLNTLVWLACHPDPASLDQPKCADYDTLSLLQSSDAGLDASALPEGLIALGMTPPPGAPQLPVIYPAPADVFANLPSDDPRRTRGVLAIVLMLAVAEPPPPTWPPTQADLTALLGRVRNKQVDSVLTIKRLRISETSTPNHNPTLATLKIGEEEWGAGPQPAKLLPGIWTHLYSFAGEGSKETYQDLDVDGNAVSKTEHLSTSWFTTLGELDKSRTVEGDIEKPEHIYEPLVLADLPPDRRGTLYAVLRDSRGGVDTHARPFILCDPNLPPPVVTEIRPASGPPGTTVTLTGFELADLLDVRAGTGWLSSAAWDDAQQAFVGKVPADAPAGELSLVPRGRGCAADPTVKFTVAAP
jgi:hypothetical protein